MGQASYSNHKPQESSHSPPKRSCESKVESSANLPCPRVAIDEYLLEAFTSDSTSTNTDTTQDEGAVPLSSIDSWGEKRFTQLDIEEAAWTPERQGESGPSGCRGRVGMERLDRWMEQVRQMNTERERTEEEERKKRRWHRWLEVPVKKSDESVSVEMETRDGSTGAGRSCASEKLRVKKGNKFFRARRRAANLFRRVGRPVESVAAQKRFGID